MFYKTLNGRLSPEDGSVRPQTLGKRVSDDPRHFIVRRRTQKLIRIFRKRRRSVYPPRMAPFGLKLWENAFQMIPDISFFDAENAPSNLFFTKF